MTGMPLLNSVQGNRVYAGYAADRFELNRSRALWFINRRAIVNYSKIVASRAMASSTISAGAAAGRSEKRIDPYGI